MPSRSRPRVPATRAAPRSRDLASLSAEAAGCRACPLWQRATQTVFGAGPPDASLMLVGEQPGDHEDREGAPFVGPAGHLLDRALADAGIDRGATYMTNAVKHFKWEERGKRRLHKRPTRSELLACAPWLEAELAVVQPSLVVLLGATAVEALLGPGVTVGARRGEPVETASGRLALATVHPSSILRAKDEDRARHYDAFVADLRVAASVAAAS